MRILYLCQRVPYPPTKGDKLRAFHQLRALGGMHEVDLFTLADEAEDLNHQQVLTQYCRAVTIRPAPTKMRRLWSMRTALGRPLTLPYFYSPELEADVAAALASRSYDCVVVYCSSMAQYVRYVHDIPIVIDFVDIDSDKLAQYAVHSRFPLSLVYKREAHRLREYEADLCAAFSSVVVTTEREARVLLDLVPEARVGIVRNGVDSDFFHIPDRNPVSQPTMIFTGDMSYLPNELAAVHFAKHVLPVVRRSVPEAQFLIVGRNPTEAVQQLAGISGVEVTGFVPDVCPWLGRAHVAVAPLTIACGVQNKILEAMSCEVPVVASEKAMQGLAPSVAAVVSSGSGVEEIATACCRLLGDRQLALRTGQECRRRVIADYNWDRSGKQLLEIIASHIPNRDRRVVPQ